MKERKKKIKTKGQSENLSNVIASKRNFYTDFSTSLWHTLNSKSPTLLYYLHLFSKNIILTPSKNWIERTEWECSRRCEWEFLNREKKIFYWIKLSNCPHFLSKFIVLKVSLHMTCVICGATSNTCNLNANLSNEKLSLMHDNNKCHPRAIFSIIMQITLVIQEVFLGHAYNTCPMTS